MRWFVGVVAAVSMLATACDTVPTEAEAQSEDLPAYSEFGTIVIDRDDGSHVECAWYKAYNAGGLSCNWEAANKLPASVDR